VTVPGAGGSTVVAGSAPGRQPSIVCAKVDGGEDSSLSNTRTTLPCTETVAVLAGTSSSAISAPSSCSAYVVAWASSSSTCSAPVTGSNSEPSDKVSQIRSLATPSPSSVSVGPPASSPSWTRHCSNVGVVASAGAATSVGEGEAVGVSLAVPADVLGVPSGVGSDPASSPPSSLQAERAVSARRRVPVARPAFGIRIVMAGILRDRHCGGAAGSVGQRW
jgi:hypothetical protein